MRSERDLAAHAGVTEIVRFATRAWVEGMVAVGVSLAVTEEA